MSLLEAHLLLAVAGLAGGLPLALRWSPHALHVLASTAAGLLLGTVFLHLLPELGATHGSGHEPSKLPWLVGLAGFLGLFFVEKVWLEGRAADAHRVVWTATFTGLSLHSIVAGLALAGVVRTGLESWPVVAALALHKVGESFSLATVMRLAELRGRRLLFFLLAFAAMTPLGLVAGGLLATGGVAHSPAIEGFACGTFLYVAACDLLPEVFHGRGAKWQQGLGVVAGVALVAGFDLFA